MFQVGPNRNFPVATDSNSVTSSPVSLILTVAADPSIAMLSATAAAVDRGNNVTLTADVSDPANLAITSVNFYYDTNQDGILQTGTDQLLGTATRGANGAFTWTGSTAGFALGTATYFAVATNGAGLTSSTASATNTIEFDPPVIASLTANPQTLDEGGSLTLTANAVTAPDAGDTITAVQFYSDSTGDGTFNPAVNTLLGSATSGSSGNWSLALSNVHLPAGAIMYFAVAQDAYGVGAPASTPGTVIASATPTIAALNVTPGQVNLSDNITLTATGVADTDGTVTSVAFYQDYIDDGTIMPGTIKNTPLLNILLGTATVGSGGTWSITVSPASYPDFPTGTVEYLAQAMDNNGESSANASTTNTVLPLPVAQGVTSDPTNLAGITPPMIIDGNPLQGTAVQGQPITLTAENVTVAAPDTITQVMFYLDANNDDVLEPGTDTLLGTVTTGSNGNYTWSNATDTLPIGLDHVFQVAEDNTGGLSVPVMSTVYVEAGPTIGSLAASPNPLTAPGTLTLTASGVSDPAGMGITGVSFYLDPNNTGVFDSTTDLLLGAATSETGGSWSWSGSTAEFPTGTVRDFYAVAQNTEGLTGNAATTTDTINVAQATLTVTGTNVAATVGQSVTGEVASFTDPNPDSPSGPTVGLFAATINWGDGTETAGVITQPGGAGNPFFVTGTHTFAHSGSDTIDISITGTDSSAGAATATATVTGTTPTLTWANPADIVYGTLLGATQLDATANVPGTFVYTPASGVLLTVGSKQTLSVVFTPTDAADYATVNDSVQINVTPQTPILTWANPADIPYGTALGALQLDASANVPGVLTYTPASGTVLPPGAHQSLSVAFTPTDQLDYAPASDSVVITVDNATMGVIGNGVTIADGASTPSKGNSTDYGSVLVNSPTVNETYTLTNTGTALLTLGAITLPAGFSTIIAPALSLGAGTSTTMVVGLNAGTVGTFAGNVSIANNDPYHNPYTFAVTGSVLLSTTYISGNGVNIANGATTLDAADGTDFGSIVQGLTPLNNTFTIQNTGTSPLTLGAVTLPNGFSLTMPPAAIVAAGGSTTFMIGLSRVTSGTYGGVVSFLTGDPYNNPFTFTVTGTVTAPSVSGNGQPIPDGSTSPSPANATNFGSAGKSGNTLKETYTIANPSASVLTVDGVTLPTGYSLIAAPAGSVGVGGTTTFTVGLSTTTLGTFAGTVTITTSDPADSPYAFAITGTITAQPALPTIGSLTTNVPGVTKGSSLILTANNVVIPSPGTIKAVYFYTGSAGAFNASTDKLLGTGKAINSTTWSLTLNTKTLAVGTDTFFVRALDKYSRYSNAVSTTAAIYDYPPAITKLTSTNKSVAASNSVTLAAGGVSDPYNTVTSVRFYWDPSGTGTTAGAVLLGTATASQGWKLTTALPSATAATNPFPTGGPAAIFVAQAIDASGTLGNVVKVSIPVAAQPAIGLLDISPSPINHAGAVTIPVTDPVNPATSGLKITQVQIWLEPAGATVLNTAIDKLLGLGVKELDGDWALNLKNMSKYAPGDYVIFARAEDSNGIWSDAAIQDVTIV